MSSFARGVTIGLVAATGVIGAGLALRHFAIKASGDEQPPIIVGDGSIDVFSDYDPHGHGRGEFEKVPPDNSFKWRYRHAAGAPTARVDVVVLDGTAGSTSDCENGDKPFENLKQMTVVYTPSGTVTVDFDPSQANKFDRLQVTFSSGLAVSPYKQFWLRAPNVLTGTPALYTLSTVKIMNQSGVSWDCNLSYTSQLRLVQIK